MINFIEYLKHTEKLYNSILKVSKISIQKFLNTPTLNKNDAKSHDYNNQILFQRLYDIELHSVNANYLHEYLLLFSTPLQYTIIEVYGKTIERAFAKIELELQSNSGITYAVIYTLTKALYQKRVNNQLQLYEIITPNLLYLCPHCVIAERILTACCIKEQCEFASFKENVRISLVVKIK